MDGWKMDDGWTEGKGWRMNGLMGRCIQMGIWKGNSEVNGRRIGREDGDRWFIGYRSKKIHR